jgi:subtilisin family serine protease/PKD repeat protein
MSRVLNVLVIVCLCLALLPFSSVEAQLPTDIPSGPTASISNSSSLILPLRPAYVPGQVIVKLRDGVTLSQGPGKPASANRAALAATLSRIGARQSARVFSDALAQQRTDEPGSAVSDLARIYRLKLNDGVDVQTAVAALSADPNVEYAEPDYIARAADTQRISGWTVSHPLTPALPKGPERSAGASVRFQSVAPDDPLYPAQWGLAKIGAEAAWSVVTGTPAVDIAIVDSGIDLTHPDFANQLWINPGEIADNGVDDDNDGYVDDVNGWDFVYGTNNVVDENGHGTEVAGVAGAGANNGVGIAGLCWNCRLMVVKVMQPSGIANYSDVAAGVAYAASKGAKVINLSVGGYADSRALRDAITAAVAQGAVVVGGAGNDNVSTPFYPAAYDNVLAVAGTTISDTKSTFSDYGTWVDVSAPAVNITTTLMGSNYGPASGTSLAAPFVSGLAGLLRSLHPDWSPALVGAQIIHTTDDIDSANPDHAGWLGDGRINAGKAVTTTPIPVIQFINYAADSQTNGSLKAGATVSVVVTLRNDWLSASSVTATLSTISSDVSVTKANAVWGAINSWQSVANNTDPLQVSVPAGKYGLVIPFRLNVVADGVASTQTFTATTESQAVAVGGTLVSDTVWTNDRVYLVSGNVIVNSGVTLKIQPGTTIKFGAGKAMVVQGSLIASGTVESPILFTSAAASPSRGDWDTIEVRGSAIFEHVTIQYGGFGIAAYSNSTLQVRHSIIRYNGFVPTNYRCGDWGSGICITGGNATLENNRIYRNDGFLINSGNGVILQSGSAVIRGNIISENGLIAPQSTHDTGGGVKYTGGTLTIAHNLLTGNKVGLVARAWPSGMGMLPVHDNAIFGNTWYDAMSLFGQAVTATYNYWGTTNGDLIAEHIYDVADDINSGQVNYVPFLSEPSPGTPAFLRNLAISPASPVGIQPITFDLTFSGPMDQSINPVVTFGATAPYTSFIVSENAHWLSDWVWSATYDITSLVPRGAYTISVTSAKGATTVLSGTVAIPVPDGGMEIPTDTRFGFAVDYAGSINVTTPPPAPAVNACGASTADRLSARWNVNAPGAPITLYRYAIGTTPGAADVVNWTDTPLTSTTRVSLTLTAGQTYYVSVKARNEGGLWSEAGDSPGVVAGSGGCPVAGFSASPTTGPAPLNVQFTDTSSGNVTARQWGFGDGSADTSLNPTHIYTASGVYTVSLNVAGPGGGDERVRGGYIVVSAGSTYSISGRVTDGVNPIVGVSLSIGAGGSATTDASGYYTLTNVASGAYTLVPSKNGYTFSPPSRAVSVPPDATNQNFVGTVNVGPTYSVAGRVVNNTAQPMLNVLVASSSGGAAYTDASGYYTLTNVITGTYTLTPTLSGYTFSPVTRTVSVPPSATNQDFTGTLVAGPTYSISGRVTDGVNPIVGVSLSIGAGGSAMSDASGYYTLTNVTAGMYTLVPSKNGYTFSPLSRAVSVPPDATNQNFVGAVNVGPTYSIAGRVVNNTAQPMLSVLVASSSGGAAYTDASGYYTLTNLNTGTYTLTPTFSGYTFSPVTRTVSVPPSATNQDFTGTPVAGPTYSISGRVTDGINPIVGVSLSIGAGGSATTDASGYYTLTNVAAGMYTLVPTKNGYTFSPPSRAVSVPPDVANQNFVGTVNVGPTYSVAGRVVNNTAQPMFNVLVASSSGGAAYTDASGYYTLTNVISGTYTLTPTLSGYTFLPVTRTVSVPPSQTEQDFTGTSKKFVFLPVVLK